MSIYLLPTRSPRKYRGKYPTKVHSSGGPSVSPDQAFIGILLKIQSPMHIELNDGRRYILSARQVIKPHALCGRDFAFVPKDDTIQITEMSQETYDEMLKTINAIRLAERDLNRRIKYRKSGGDDKYSWAVFRDGLIVANGMDITEARCLRDRLVREGSFKACGIEA